MIGYKAFNKDMTCYDRFRYEIGSTYITDKEPEICSWGFHFCKELEDVFHFYPFSKDTRVCKVEAFNTIKNNDGKKFCTNVLTILEEINFDHLFQLHFHKKADYKSIDLSDFTIGKKISLNGHDFRCVSIQNHKYIFAFDDIMIILPLYKIYSFLRQKKSYTAWLPQEWIDNISDIFIPNGDEVGNNYFLPYAVMSSRVSLTPLTYYQNLSNRVKYCKSGNGQGIVRCSWWLSHMFSPSTSVYISADGNLNTTSNNSTAGVSPHFIIER